MNALASDLVRKEPWTGLMMGNHAVARAILEERAGVITSYPGSPVPEIGEALQSIPAGEREFYFEYSVNEKAASEIAFGASVNGHLSVVFFKSVGLNVAADAIVQMAMLHAKGGMVIILGDDPGANSSQNEQDNRYMSRMMYIPMFEPANPEEAYEMFRRAASLSRQHAVPVFLRLTTHVCHAYSLISFRGIEKRVHPFEPSFDPSGHSYFPLVSESMRLKKNLLQKLDVIAQSDAAYPKTGEWKHDRGIVCAGMPYLAVEELLEDADAGIDILKLDLIFPLPIRQLSDFMAAHREVLVIEELDRIIEKDLKTLCYDRQLSCRIFSKPDTFIQGELGLDEVHAVLNSVWPDSFSEPESPPVTDEQILPPRLAQFCAGCGHRSAFYAIKQALPDGDTTFTVAGIGCHLMGNFDPYNVGRILLCMGHSPSTASGLSIGNSKRKVVAFLGDSTFFHSGMPAVTNAALYNHNITLVIMDNSTTAMTGHQSNAGSGELLTIDGRKASKVDIYSVLKSLNVEFIRSVTAIQHDKIREAISESLSFKGFAAVIIKQPCMLKTLRKKKNQAVQQAQTVEIK